MLTDMLQIEVEVQRCEPDPCEAEHTTPASRSGHRFADAALERVTRLGPHEEAEPKDTFGSYGSGIGDASPPHPQREVMAYAPPSNEALSNLTQQPLGSEVVHEDEDEWVSDQSSLEDVVQAKVPHAKKRLSAGGSSRKKKRADDRRPSIRPPHYHSRASLPEIDTSASTGSGTATATAPSAPSISAAPESPLPRTPSFPSDIVDDASRGRSPYASASSTFAARRKPQHVRIVSLLGGEDGSREDSPARSIRWADGTARGPPSAQGSRAPSPSPADGADNG